MTFSLTDDGQRAIAFFWDSWRVKFLGINNKTWEIEELEWRGARDSRGIQMRRGADEEARGEDGDSMGRQRWGLDRENRVLSKAAVWESCKAHPWPRFSASPQIPHPHECLIMPPTVAVFTPNAFKLQFSCGRGERGRHRERERNPIQLRWRKRKIDLGISPHWRGKIWVS